MEEMIVHSSSPPSSRHSRVEDFLLRHVETGDWPGAVYAFGPAGERPRYFGAVGMSAVEPQSAPAREDGLYDLASLTKALFTAPAILRLADRGVFDLDEPIDRRLGEWPSSEEAAPTIRQAMMHQAGFPAWLPLYREAACPASVVEVIARSRVDAGGTGPGASAPTRYSCLGPILLGLLLERATGHGLRGLLAREIREPLGIAEDDLDFGPIRAPQRLERTAPTEAGREVEAELAGCVFERRPPFRGTVHDGNAEFLGGAAGNAGLFATAGAVFRVASAMLGPGRWLSEPSRRLLSSPQGLEPAGDGEVRTFGFASGAAVDAPAGAFGGHSFGHVGFTGTSVWLSPERGMVAVLLSNRVHPKARKDTPIQSLRRRYHDLVVECLETDA